MLIQSLLVLIFLLNILLFWFFVYGGKFKAYRYCGLGLFFLVPLISVFFDQPRFALDHFWWIVAGYFLAAAGLGLLVWARQEFKRQGIPAEELPGEALVTTGPYAWLRHPQYLGAIFIFVGWWWIAAAVYSFYFGMIVLGLIWLNAYFEEKFLLEKKFGRKFLDYREKAGMFWVK